MKVKKTLVSGFGLTILISILLLCVSFGINQVQKNTFGTL